MYLRLVLLLLLVLLERQVSSYVHSISSSITSSAESSVCLPNRTETCSISTESSPSSSSSFLSIDRMYEDMELKQQNLRINAMAKKLKTLAIRFFKLPPIPEAYDEFSLYGRVSLLEGSGCGPDKVQCGARTRAQCISDLFVCDGFTDCINGRDEDPHICSEDPVRVGNTFVGFSFWHSCLSRKPHRSMIVLTRSRRDPAFKARVWLSALFINHVAGDIITNHVTGYFNFARRQIVLLPIETTGEDYGVQCLFSRGDDVHLDCKIIRPGSYRKCGSITLARL